MSTLAHATTTIENVHPDPGVAEAELAAAAFLARYSGRTLDAYRDDLRTFCAPDN